jgi:arylsulfatase A-like enzyme
VSVIGVCKLAAETKREEAGATRASARDGAGTIGVLFYSLAWGAWFGVMTGFAELGVLLFQNYHTGGVALGKLQLNRHFTWMVPVSDALIFLATGLLVGIVGIFAPRWTTRFRPHIFCFMAFLALCLMLPGLFVTARIALAGGLAFVVGRRISRHSQWFCLGVLRSLPCFLVGLASLSAWVSAANLLAADSARTRPAAATPKATNVVLIVMDTVRAASLSLHGYDRDTTPNLVRLARRAIRFEQARSTAPWTLPSHASMFTGKWPHDFKVSETVPLDSTYLTLAEFLSGRGFATGGFVANAFFCNAWYGLGRGFEHYEDFYGDEIVVSLTETLHCSRLGHGLLAMTGHPLLVDHPRKDAARINRDFLNWHVTTQGKPFFAFLNYFDAHAPFVPPDGFERRFAPRPLSPAEKTTLIDWDKRTRDKISKQDAVLARDAYDDCIAYIDQQLGVLIEELERRGVLDRTLVIITSDHGESMGEHGFFGHGKSLYNQELHVPLLIIPPGGLSAGLSVPTPVSLRDIPATVADLVGAGKDSPFDGRSLARLWGPRRLKRSANSGAVLSEVSLWQKVTNKTDIPPAWRGRMSSLVADGKTYIRCANKTEELFDVEDDPGQLHDLAGAPVLAPVLAGLKTKLRILCPELNWD